MSAGGQPVPARWRGSGSPGHRGVRPGGGAPDPGGRETAAPRHAEVRQAAPEPRGLHRDHGPAGPGTGGAGRPAHREWRWQAVLQGALQAAGRGPQPGQEAAEGGGAAGRRGAGDGEPRPGLHPGLHVVLLLQVRAHAEVEGKCVLPGIYRLILRGADVFCEG